MSTPRYFTAVFQIEDNTQFKEFVQELIASMANEAQYRGAVVTGASWRDDMSRADALVALCEEAGIDIPEELQ